jgi:thiol-disulfide isomerase/thioredoxin
LRADAPLALCHNSEKLKVVKINTENYPALASKYNVRGASRGAACHVAAVCCADAYVLASQINALPTLVLFKGGQPVDRLEGLPTAAQLIARVRPHL